jgi:hypothetical protein
MFPRNVVRRAGAHGRRGSMALPQLRQISSRRRLLQFLVAGTLCTQRGVPALAQNAAPPRLPDPMSWAPRDLNNLISDPKEALDVFDFEPVAKRICRRHISDTWPPVSMMK